jgi:hypothetical protein
MNLMVVINETNILLADNYWHYRNYASMVEITQLFLQWKNNCRGRGFSKKRDS